MSAVTGADLCDPEEDKTGTKSGCMDD